jgi:RNA polymerase sigma factor (sigma-70 family)
MKIFEILSEKEKVKNPNQKLALYNPDGKTYRHDSMPTLEPDPVDNAEPLSLVPDEPYETNFNKDFLKKSIIKHLDKLTERQRKIIKLRFWDEMTHKEIGKELNISDSRAQQIEAKAMRILRKSLGRDKKDDYIENIQGKNHES